MTELLTFGVAETAEERNAVFALRYAAALERGWTGAASVTEGLERDEYDEDALLLVARSGDEIVATLRLVVELERVRALLGEHGFAADVPAEGTIEVGRLTVARPHRKRSRELMVGLLAEGVRATLARGVARWVSFAEENSIRFCRRHGFPVKVVGTPGLVDTAPRRLVVCDAEVFEAFLGAATEHERALFAQASQEA